MSAFVISEVRIVDADAAKRYMALAEQAIRRHGGRYVARAATPEVPEGDWDGDRRIVIVESPTMESLKAWYRSDDHAEALAIGRTALHRRLLFVAGLAD